MRITVMIFFLFLACKISCQLESSTISSIEKTILNVNSLMVSEFNKGNYSNIGSFYADSASMIGNKVQVSGKDNIIEYWGKFEGAHEWQLENIEIKSLGTKSALQRGYSDISYYNADTLLTSRSIFTLVWIKIDEGWKILVDHFSPG